MNRIRDEKEALSVAGELSRAWAKTSAERDAQRRLPQDEVAQLCASGLLGITVPREHGGIDVSKLCLVRVLDRLSAGDPNLGQIPVGHFYIVDALRNGASDAQRRRWYPRILDGEMFGNAFAEAGGKTCGDVNTRLTRHGDTCRIEGAKFYSTGSLYARHVAVVALDEEDKVQMPLVPRETAGLTLVDDWSGMGQRTTASGTTRLESVTVPAEDVLPHHQCFEALSPQVLNASLLHPAVDLGIARGAFEDARRFVLEHARPWLETTYDRASQDPYVIHKFGEMALLIDAADALLERAAAAADAAAKDLTDESVARGQVAVAKATAMAERAALFVSSTLFEVGGTRSTLSKWNHDRHWRNARTHTLHDPVSYKYARIGNWHLNGVAPRKDR